MRRNRGVNLVRRFSLGVLIATLELAVTGPTAWCAQGGSGIVGDKQLDVAPERVWDPVWITKVSVADKFLLAPYSNRRARLPNEIPPGQPLQAGQDWLSNMVIYVENRTDKPISRLEISMRFPETGDGRTQPTWIYQFQLGRIPDPDAYNGRTGKPIPVDPLAKPLNLKPGQVLAVHVVDYIEKIRAYVETAMPLTEVSSVYLYVSLCEFDDGMCWTAGAYSVPDPSKPGRFSYLNSKYFPGNWRKYLPNVPTK